MPKTNVHLRHQNELFVDLPVPAKPTDHRFYVLFHGLISLVEGKNNEFRAYALTMGDDHRYRFGHWLVEQDLPQGMRGTLHGVKASEKTKENSLNPAMNPTVRVKGWPKDDDPYIRARLTLPRPRKIHYLGLGHAELTQPELLMHPAPSACGLTVFEYDLPGSLDDLEIHSDDGKQQHWKASRLTEFSQAGTKLVTLNVIDAPLHTPGTAAHSLDEFAMSMRLLGQPAVRLVRKPTDHAQQPAPPDGISDYEVAAYSERPKFLHRIADFARTARFGGSQALSDDNCKSCCSAGDGDGS